MGTRRPAPTSPCLAAEIVETLARAQQEQADPLQADHPASPEPTQGTPYRWLSSEILLYHAFIFAIVSFNLVMIDLSRDMRPSWSLISVAVWGGVLVLHRGVLSLTAHLVRRPGVSEEDGGPRR